MNDKQKLIKLDSKRHYITAIPNLVNIHNKQARTNLLLDVEDVKVLISQLQECLKSSEGFSHAK